METAGITGFFQGDEVNMLTDLHTHTHHSYDAASDTVAERIHAAKERGLCVMAVTDHVELNRFYPADDYGAQETEVFPYNFRAAFEGSLAETCAAQADCRDTVLLCGCEFGQIPQTPALAKRLYADPRLDLVIGSVHELPGKADFYFLDYEHEDIPALIHAYFDEVLRLAQTDCYDILAHLTYGLRYLPNRAGFDLTPYYPQIDAIFDTLIAKGKALELNGSGLKYTDAPYTDPDVSLVCRYRRRGGTLLTLATDAHETRYLGYGMDTLEQAAKDAGFDKLTYFVRHEPRFLPLI